MEEVVMLENEEKRNSERRTIEALARFEGEHFSIYSRLTNVSDSGAFLVTHYLLDPGTSIHLHYVDPARGTSDLNARVVRTVGKVGKHGAVDVGMGVEFVTRHV